jgi:hypothetical protein
VRLDDDDDDGNDGGRRMIVMGKVDGDKKSREVV